MIFNSWSSTWEIRASNLNSKITISRPANNTYTYNIQCETKGVPFFRTERTVVYLFYLSCENRHLRRNSPHGDKRLYIHTFQILQGPFPFQLFLEGQTAVWGRSHAAAPHNTRTKQLARLAGKLARHSLVQRTQLAV